jgi:hypothetical protein
MWCSAQARGSTVVGRALRVSLAGPTDTNLTVDFGSATVVVTMQASGATPFGSVVVSGDARYLAYGSYIGTFASGHCNATVVDLSNGATVSSVSGDTPVQWLADDRLVVSPSFVGGATYLPSPSFDSRSSCRPIRRPERSRRSRTRNHRLTVPAEKWAPAPEVAAR